MKNDTTSANKLQNILTSRLMNWVKIILNIYCYSKFHASCEAIIRHLLFTCLPLLALTNRWSSVSKAVQIIITVSEAK